MSPLLITSLVLVVSMVLFLSERLRPDLVALMVVVTLAVTNVLTQQEAFSGFSRSAVMTMLAVFILAEGLVRAGVADQLGRLLLRLAGASELRLLVVVMAGGAFLSLFMNNIAAASLLMPAVAGAARQTGVSPSRLLMPLAFATILGGMATLFTTTNLVASAVLRDAGLKGFGVLSFASVGLPIMLVGGGYMAVVGRRLLPQRASTERQAAMDEATADLVRVYRLGDNLFRARIPAGSSLIDCRIEECALRERFGCSILAIERDPRFILSPTPDAVLLEDDVLVLKGVLEDFRNRDVKPYLEILPSPTWSEEHLSAPEDMVVEAMLSPRSTLIGRTPRKARFRARYGVNILAIWRAGDQVRVGVRDTVLQFGDALLLQGHRSQLPVLREQTDFILMVEDEEALEASAHVTRARKRWALFVFAATLGCAVLMPDDVAEIMLGGAIGMLLGGVLDMDQAYRAIDWKSIFLVAGLLPLGLAMVKTGAARLIAGEVVSRLAPFGGVAVLAALCFVAVALTQVMSGAAVTALLGPVALQSAAAMNLEPRALLMGVALATSMAFLTPLGSPVNVLVMGQGGYRFRDYARVGAGLTAVLFVLLLLVLPRLWPLSAP